MDTQLYDPKNSSSTGLIDGYYFMGWTLNEILAKFDRGYEELWIGVGMRNLRYFKVVVHGLQEDLLDISGSEYYYPD